ncbi:MAG: hypothetical protein IKS39_02965 [Clostridia bacterium]|nr:hypothetical protein [Clostridia bacterium]
MKRFFNHFKGNKGSGILTVMLAVTFLTAVGTLSMYLTYTSFQVAASDRINRKVSYNAITCMEEIKAGMQTIVSDAVKETYKEVMPDYVFKKGDITKEFANSYFNRVCSSEGIFTIGKNGSGEYNDTGYYTAAAIENLVYEKRKGEVDVVSESIASGYEDSAGEIGNVIIEKDAEGNPTGLILEGVRVTYIEQGRHSTVCADIKIGIPNIGWLMTQYAIKGIPDFSLICNGKLKQVNDLSSFTGTEKNGIYRSSAYVGGGVKLSSNNFFEIDGSTLISKKEIDISGVTPVSQAADYGDDSIGHFRFKVSPNSTLWAGDVNIGDNGSARLLGTSYVANDLTFSGANAFTRISGTYFGFGTGGADNTDYYNYDPEVDDSRPAYKYGSSGISSSIISNAKGSVLYMGNSKGKSTGSIEELNLAGVSFISNVDSSGSRYASVADFLNSTVTEPSTVPMGESVSGYLNQGMYYPPYGTVTILEAEKTLEDILDEDGSVVKEYFTEEIFNDEGMVVDLRYIEHDVVNDTYRYCSYDDDNTLVYGDYTVWGAFNPKSKSREFDSGASKMTIMSRAEFSKVIGFELNTDDLGAYIPGKKFSDYGITLKPYYKPIGDDNVAIFFMLTFENQEKANQYYADYFNASVANGDRLNIRRNLVSYLNVIGDGTVRAFTSGSMPPATGSDAMQATAPKLEDIRYISEKADFIGKIFSNYCKTLTNAEVVPDPEKPYTLADNPYDYYVNSQKIDELFANGLDTDGDNQIDFYHRDKLTTKIVRGDYEYNGSADDADLCLIVVKDGNVTVKADFSGLIICDGDVTLDGAVEFTNASEKVLAAYSADSISGKEDGEFFKSIFNFDFASQYEDSVSAQGDAWNVAKLVTFSKWKKD